MNKRIMKTKTRFCTLGDIVVMLGREGVVRNVDAKEWDVLDVWTVVVVVFANGGARRLPVV